jgi:hypothetical protein
MAEARHRIVKALVARETGPKVVRTYDVPYLAGSSNDDRTVYIDRRVPRETTISGVTFDPAEPLSVHEQTEHRAMRRGIPYQTAHETVATPAERRWVESHGIDWKRYEAFMDGLLAHIEHEHPVHPPPDLYVKPYPHAKQLLLRREGHR